ncbi:efflux RND transporter periplasmic adaptor subunit [Aquimarina agarivorans]|uniref:efflux RND transporter periplasmic adaptor subunit n=1 Tax=Aquimarina agarivorans TaxID=980584 RepID=UPI000248FD35|nr:efflux RND transporter periplasmic adaptor subunit [Aquimarina agarivorans]
MDIKIEKKKGIRPKQVLILLGVGLLLLLCWKLLTTDFKNVHMVQKERLSIGEVVQGKFHDFITVTGHVAPIRTIYMDAYEGGRVKEKHIEEGAFVKKGDIILTLENRNLYEQILASENSLALKQNDLRSTKLAYDSREISGRKELIDAKYELQKKQRNFKQQQALFNEGLIAKELFLVAQEDFEATKKRFDLISEQVTKDGILKGTSLKDLDGDLQRMKKTLSMVYERLDYLNVKAPFNGQLGFLDAEIGQNIQQGQRIGQINDLSNFKIEAEVDEHYIERVRRDLNASINRKDKSYPLRVRKVYPEVRNGRFKIDLVFEGDTPETMRAGQNYTMHLQLGASNEALLIPRGSFFQSTGGRHIFILNDDGTEAFKKEIKLGRQNSKYFEVLEGLKPGQKTIISNYDAYKNVERIVFK